MQLNAHFTLVAACLVLLLGSLLVKKINFLKKYHIPEPVAGGFLVAIGLLAVYQAWGIEFNFDKALQDSLMLAFFSSIGLSADFSRLIKGGKPILIFVAVASALIFVQNTVGMSLALALDQNPFYGLIAGSITLSGGHGSGAAWGALLSEKYGVTGAVELAMACATFGLVLGGTIGGPVARRLLKKIDRQPQVENEEEEVEVAFERPNQGRRINASAIIETVTMLAICLSVGTYLDSITKDTALQLPTFVWCLFTGVIIRNVLTHIVRHDVFDRAVDVLGSVSLSLFLAIALMSLKLWQLAELAVPVLIILSIQTLVMALFAYFITFKIMGKDYDAIVLSAGHCGFGLGATPTAIANMQVITQSFGPSHKAFLIVPMVGAFFIDIVNTAMIKLFIEIGGNFL
ncbi:sodium/glutamate symporter [Neisseriaceae bacterium CLB008]